MVAVTCHRIAPATTYFWRARSLVIVFTKMKNSGTARRKGSHKIGNTEEKSTLGILCSKDMSHDC